MIWHYTCHPTAVVPDNAISADYPGAVRRALARRFGDVHASSCRGFAAISGRRCGPRAGEPACARVFAASHAWRSRGRCSRPRRPRTGRDGAKAWPRGPLTSRRNHREKRTSPAQPATRIGQHSARRFLRRLRARQAARHPDRENRRGIRDDRDVSGSHRGMAGDSRSGDTRAAGRIRLYAGYLGALFGYLPTAAQIGKAAMRSRDSSACSGCRANSSQNRLHRPWSNA